MCPSTYESYQSIGHQTTLVFVTYMSALLKEAPVHVCVYLQRIRHDTLKLKSYYVLVAEELNLLNSVMCML